MERLKLETIENIIKTHKTVVEVLENEDIDDDYDLSLDKCIIRGMEELKQYRIAEEQGLLLRLPVPNGTTVWNIDHIYECKHAYNCPLEFDNYKCEANISCRHEYKVLRVREKVFNYKMFEDIGKTVFLAKEAAEQALAKMKEV